MLERLNTLFALMPAVSRATGINFQWPEFASSTEAAAALAARDAVLPDPLPEAPMIVDDREVFGSMAQAGKQP